MNPLHLPLAPILMPLETTIAAASPPFLTGDFAVRLATELAAITADPAPLSVETHLPAPAAPDAAAKPQPMVLPPTSPAARTCKTAKADDHPPSEAPLAAAITEPPSGPSSGPVPVPVPSSDPVPCLDSGPETIILPPSPDNSERPLPVQSAESPPAPGAAPIADRPRLQAPPRSQPAMMQAVFAGEAARPAQHARPDTGSNPNPGPSSNPGPLTGPPLLEISHTPVVIAPPHLVELSATPAADFVKPPLDMQNDAWVASLSKEILLAHENGAPLSFRLAPHFLGALQVGLTETANGLVIELRPSSAEAAAILAREEPRLAEELRQRGVSVSETNLQFGASSDGRNSRSGANLRPFQPLQFSDPHRVQDQNQHRTRPPGRFA